MTKIILCYGWCGYPEENWFPWFKQELEKNKINCIIPVLPNSNNPQLEDWLLELKNNLNYDDEFILVGHSLGGYLILKFLEENNYRIRKVFLIGSFMKTVNIQEIESFFVNELNFDKIKSQNLSITAYNSENDPYVPASYNNDWKKINAKSMIVKNAGHFNSASGWNKIPFLLEEILNLYE